MSYSGFHAFEHRRRQMSERFSSLFVAIWDIGMSVDRRIVDEQDSLIEAANRVAGGAAFTVWSPKIEK